MTRIDRNRLRDAVDRGRLLDLLEAGLRAIEPGRLVRAAVTCDGASLRFGDRVHDAGRGRVWILSVGKAALAMASAAVGVLGPHLAGGLAITRYGYGGIVAGLRVFEAGHPFPDRHGLLASREVVDWIDRVDDGDLVLCLLSGGGSALLARPPDEIDVEELATTTRILLESGAAIDEINTVRRHLSRLQGGRLARLLDPAEVWTLALSDVVGDRLEAIASGPTVPDPTTFRDAWRVLEARRLLGAVPPSVRTYLERGLTGQVPETPKPGDPAFARTLARVIGGNRTIVDAICRSGREVGLRVVRVDEPAVGEAREVGRDLGRRARSLAANAGESILMVAGGETTVRVVGSGLGGRNQELALAAAIEIDGLTNVRIAALATDGTDGPTDAAGAIVDGETIARAGDAGLAASEALAGNDAHPLLAASGDLLFTGPTRTNVADVTVAWIDPTGR